MALRRCQVGTFDSRRRLLFLSQWRMQMRCRHSRVNSVMRSDGVKSLLKRSKEWHCACSCLNTCRSSSDKRRGLSTHEQ